MGLRLLFIACFGLFLQLVRAGADVRGIEALIFYDFYRCDVEVSSDEAIKKGEDPDKNRPWKVAHQAYNLPSDFPSGVLDESKHGANIHGFLRSTAQDGYAKDTGLTKVADSWKPTVDEMKDLATWPPIIKGKRYSYAGFQPKDMLGTLTKGAPMSIPDPNDPKKRIKNPIYDFDNMLAILGKHMLNLYDKNPEIAKPYMERLASNLALARRGRIKESAEFKIDDIKKEMEALDKKENKGGLKGASGMVKTKKVKDDFFGEYEVFDNDATKQALKKGMGKDFHAKAKVRLAAVVDSYKTGIGLDPQTASHMDVVKQEQKLSTAITTHLGGTSSDMCGYPSPLKR